MVVIEDSRFGDWRDKLRKAITEGADEVNENCVFLFVNFRQVDWEEIFSSPFHEPRIPWYRVWFCYCTGMESGLSNLFRGPLFTSALTSLNFQFTGNIASPGFGEALGMACQSCTCLVKLRLRGIKWTAAAMEPMARLGICHLPGLQSVTMEGTIEDDGRTMEYFAQAASCCHSLRELHCSGYRLTDRQVATLVRVGVNAANSNLQVFDVRDNVVRQLALQALSEWLQSQNCRLQRLELEKAIDCRDPSIAPHLDAFFHALAENNTLLHLSMGCNNITDNHIPALCQALAVNPTLRTLCLQCNNISDDGVTQIALNMPSQLEGLNLSFNQGIGLSGCKAMGKALQQNAQLGCLGRFTLPLLKSTPELRSMVDQMNHLLMFNRAGRRLLVEQNKYTIPLGLWARILSRINRMPYQDLWYNRYICTEDQTRIECMNYMLRNCPVFTCSSPSPGQR